MSRASVIVMSIIAGVVGAAVVVGMAVFISFRGIEARHELSEEERGLLVQVDDLVSYGIAPRTGSSYYEEYIAKQNLDGSLELEYTYEADGESAALSLRSEAEICKDAGAAEESFDARVRAYKIGFRIGSEEGLSLSVDSSLLSLGQQRFVALLQRDGVPVGNLVVVRQDATVYSLILSSVFFDSAEELDALLAPKLAKAGTVALP